ncbi:E3 ubiquitin-protein ligase RHF2A [Mucuna pruriens]|uniref:RING-type E3 ubiquitin transferase n=1 Tax=Mucuna pruriens TaxID=157652 RepID=A0A371GAF3_MUCPR|nr:E3 ubiquitin-protein ligase RHF2A [Mucuna pruriens]
MEVPEMKGKTESHVTSAAAFVEGGIQEACDDACSICLEDFCKSEPATVTNCKHDFHLQCILEWCQRSSRCPLCWQAISLKDATSQELLEAVQLERSLRNTPSRNAAIFHHPTLGDFEFQRLPMNEGDIEQRVIQHLAAAAAMRRAHQQGWREGQRTRSPAHGHPNLLVYSTQPSASPSGEGSEPAAMPAGSPSTPLTFYGNEQSSSQQIPQYQTPSSSLTPRTIITATNPQGTHSNDRRFATHSLPASQDREQPSEQSFSDTLRSRFNAVSTRYKESISKGTRGWKERLFSPNSSMSELGSEVRRELNAKIASVSRLVERLETIRENNRAASTSLSNHLVNRSDAETSNQNNVEARSE